MFSLSATLTQSLTDPGDRETLSKRISAHLASKRRGKLRLPSHFPKEVLALSELGKAQLRREVFWVKPHTSSTHRLSNRMVRFSTTVIRGGLWNRSSATDDHMANVVGTHRLRATDWPRGARYLWPSTPSASELLEMSRRGVLHRGLEPNPRHTVKDCLSRRQVSDDIRLATSIVADKIIGIRSSVKVPREFLKYFRYRWDFLILTVRWCIPAGLVRFLLSRWVCAPTSLWLVENCRFKNFLKVHTADEFKTRQQRVSVASVSLASTPHGIGSPLAPPSVLDIDEIAFEMGDEFAELYRSLPP